MGVVVLDPRPFPIDKACGEGLMPGAVRRLNALGIGVVGRAFRGIAYVDGDRRVEADFNDGPGIGVRRTWLHEAMHLRARQLGVRFVTGGVERVDQARDHVRAAGWSARYLVGADGLHSTVRRQVGIASTSPGPSRYGLRRHFEVEPWSDVIEVHWSGRTEAYVTPVSDSLVGIAVLSENRAGFDVHLEAFPELHERLLRARAHGTRGAGPMRQSVSERTRGRVALVGDAAGYVDAITGEGIATGLACAQELAECIADDDLPAYEQRWRQATRRYRSVTSTLMWLRSRPRVGERIVPLADRVPLVFGAAVRRMG
jgi:flavin-dependent dehydrogenase